MAMAAVAEQTRTIVNGGAPANYGIKADGEAGEWMTYSAVTLTDSSFAAHNGGVNWRRADRIGVGDRAVPA